MVCTTTGERKDIIFGLKTIPHATVGAESRADTKLLLGGWCGRYISAGAVGSAKESFATIGMMAEVGCSKAASKFDRK